MIGGPTRDSATLTLVAFLLVGLVDFLVVRLQARKAPDFASSFDRESYQYIRVAQVGGFILGATAPRVLPSLQLPVDVWLVLSLGLLLAVAGMILRVWAIFTLGYLFVRVVRIEKNHRLVIRGPYRYLRHPSYSGVLLTFLGLGLAFDNLLGFAMFLVPLPAYLYRIRVEERALREALGAAYRDYSQHTCALIPGLW
jgi:protein-S-isoprenylcysteine O-methyltransferase